MASNRRAAGQTSHHLARVIARAHGDYFVSPRCVALARCALATCSSSGARQRPRSPEPAAPGSRRLMIGHARESRRPTKATLDLCATATMERNSASWARPARAVGRARQCGIGAPAHDAKGAVRCGRRRRSRPGVRSSRSPRDSAARASVGRTRERAPCRWVIRSQAEGLRRRRARAPKGSGG
jgi:hypothetical protein